MGFVIVSLVRASRKVRENVCKSWIFFNLSFSQIMNDSRNSRGWTSLEEYFLKTAKWKDSFVTLIYMQKKQLLAFERKVPRVMFKAVQEGVEAGDTTLNQTLEMARLVLIVLLWILAKKILCYDSAFATTEVLSSSSSNTSLSLNVNHWTIWYGGYSYAELNTFFQSLYHSNFTSWKRFVCSVSYRQRSHFPVESTINWRVDEF